MFAVATTPVPDDPVVIPLGLTKYSPYKFFLAYFSGKLIITNTGAFLGSWTGASLSEWLTPEATVVISVILTVIITVVLLKVDLGKLAEKISRKPVKQNTSQNVKEKFVGSKPKRIIKRFFER